MQLQLFNSEEDKLVKELTDDTATLGSTGADNGWRINVVDQDPNRERGEFEDLSKIQKYEMSSEDYSKRTGVCVLHLLLNLSCDCHVTNVFNPLLP